MCSTTRIIWCFTFLNFLVFVQCAPELAAEDSYGIISTESAIRNTVNNLFSTLKLKVMQNRLKLKQYSRIHNFFVSITLRNHNNLKKIAKLTEVDNIDNATQVFITQLNEVLNEDNKSDEETDSVYVTFVIEDFINRLDHLKDRHDVKNNTKKFDFNKAIIRYFNKKEFVNTTYSKEEFAKSNDSNDSLLSENEFWQPSGRRIFQGVGSEIKHYPFMASVQFFGKFQCSGSIIKSDLIITSGSCLQIAWNNRYFRENPSFLSVQVGSSFYDFGGEHIPVMEIYFHPSFTPKSLRHNLAIMRLRRVLFFGKKHKKVKRIEIDRHPWPLPSNVDGVVIVGWGVKTFAGTVLTGRKNKLSFATLEFYPLDECQEIYSKEFVTERNFCAGFYSKGAGACNHDAGGPGVIGGILTGVISFGAPVCGTVDAPTVFTKLGYYTDWIEEIMEMEAPTVRQQTTLRPVNLPTFHLAPVTMKTTMKIMPLVNGKPYKKPDVGRTNDEIHEFREFLKTTFKKKKEQKTLEEETEEATETSFENEVTDSLHETQEVIDTSHKTPHVTDSSDKNIRFKVKPILRNKPNTTTEENIKPSSTQLKKKIERKEKNKWSSESQSQSKDDSEDKTTSIRPTTIFENGEYTLLNSEYDGSSAEAPNGASAELTELSNDKNTSSISPRVDLNEEASTSQDTEFYEAIECLIDTLNFSDFESKERSKKKDIESNPDLADRNKHKGKKRKKTRVQVKRNNKKNKHKSYTNKRGDREYYNKKDDSSEDERDEKNGSNGYKNENEQSDNNPKPVTKTSMESLSTDTLENEDNEEVVHTVHKNNKNKLNKTSHKDKTNEEYKKMSISAESSEQENSSSNNTDRLIDMLEYEDIYKLITGRGIER